MKINMLSVKDVKYPNSASKIETLLFEGEKYNVQNNDVMSYEVYFSYKDSLVGVLKFENIMKWANDYINHLYVYKGEDGIYLQYIGREAEIKDKKGFVSLPAMSINEFYEKEKIVSKVKKEQVERFFKSFYNPSIASYKKIKRSSEKKIVTRYLLLHPLKKNEN
ncbi:hypothetical protein G1K97_13050 [Tenacibaculum finnmarkense]|uniref:hypothetical protein n=2 Tax=Tenacibaculum finnmarkense TaxID=2781243 RepID=UPI001EFC0983|nr:hypothetical protein [Tenacibaculum finnmarkense]MCG8894619.1 hypothetical protein [Tenacibaculum finnmarkense]MCG8902759.1 hypothetical protein [Tenacibaculum finnmarkense]